MMEVAGVLGGGTYMLFESIIIIGKSRNDFQRWGFVLNEI